MGTLITGNYSIKLPSRSEHEEQVALFEKIDFFKQQFPELENIAAVPNGGLRNKVVAAKLKAEGVRAGYPDIIIDVPRYGYHGAKLELKSTDPRAKLSEKQVNWFKRLGEQGYLCHCAHGVDAAWAFICWYLEIKV